MFSNFVKTALRALMRQKLFAFINIFGLSIGLTACLILILFVRHELDYDGFFKHADQIWRIETTSNIPGRPANEIATYVAPSYDLLPGDYSEIDMVARMQRRFGAVIRDGERFDEMLSYADPEFLKVFDFTFIEGSPATIAK